MCGIGKNICSTLVLKCKFLEKVDMDAYFARLRKLDTEASLNTFLNEVTRTFGHIVQVCTTSLLNPSPPLQILLAVL